MSTREIAEAVRSRCLEVAIAAYEDAGLQGLCAEGRLETAVSAIRRLDLEDLLEELRVAGFTDD